MPFKSQAQRRKFYAMESKGEIPSGTAKKWQDETGDTKLPEKVAFWFGFEKQAEGWTGGKGFFGGSGKNNFNTGETPLRVGTQESHGNAGEEHDSRNDHALMDRDRTARDFSPFETGPELQQESNPHIRY